VEQFVGKFLRAVIGRDPSEVAAVDAARAVGQLSRPLCKPLRRCLAATEFDQGLLGAPCERVHVHARRDAEQDVAGVHHAALHELVLATFVVATALFLGGCGQFDQLVEHGFDHLPVAERQRRRFQVGMPGQQALAHGFLPQQFSPRAFTQLVVPEVFTGGAEGDPIHRRHGRSRLRRGAAAASAAAAAASCGGAHGVTFPG
jgi:hypothetical protein